MVLNVHYLEIVLDQNVIQVFLRTKLNAVLALINKRSSQIKSVITSAVAEAMDYINSTPSGKLHFYVISISFGGNDYKYSFLL